MSYFNSAPQSAEVSFFNSTEDFSELLALTETLGLDASDPPTCIIRNLVVRGLRFNLLDWNSPTADPNASPIFMVHGGAVSAHTWDLVAMQLARKFRVITPDIRGHGDSEWPRDGDSDHHEMMEDLAAIINELELPPTVVVGHSMGGALVMRLALVHPELICGLGIIDFTPQSNYPGLAAGKIRLFDSLEHYAQRAAKYGDRHPDELAYAARYELLQRLDGKLMPKHDPRHVMGGPDPEYYPGTPEFEDMAAAEMPALVMWGSNSFFVTEQKCRRLAEVMPLGETSVIEDAGHQLFLEQPEQFLRAMTDFANRV
ncbi:MAG: alpha/beta hydrolase [Immundisolibacteraceae bacterium]|nr:alpha/beta hydrolase [Immundisolibacteraceae bacterium]